MASNKSGFESTVWEVLMQHLQEKFSILQAFPSSEQP